MKAEPINKITLYIDTRDNKKTVVKIVHDKRVFHLTSNIKADNLLSLIDKTLRKAKISLNNIDKIVVEKGPGSFTGLKVGIAIANGFSLCLLKEINDKKLADLETPLY